MTTRVYKNRSGSIITDPAIIEARRILTQFRRLSSLGLKSGRQYDRTVTVAELAHATRLDAAGVVKTIRDYDAWFWYLIEDGPTIESWWVSEDGE